jgi:hypothetical protein
MDAAYNRDPKAGAVGAFKNAALLSFYSLTNLITLMKSTLRRILRKVEAVQVGLLRIENQDGKRLLHARAGAHSDGLNCIISNDQPNSLVMREVSLIQKDKEDYLYLNCLVKEEVHNKSALIMSMEVLKACWFTRKSKGSVTWLQQKYSYEAVSPGLDMAS